MTATAEANEASARSFVPSFARRCFALGRATAFLRLPVVGAQVSTGISPGSTSLSSSPSAREAFAVLRFTGAVDFATASGGAEGSAPDFAAGLLDFTGGGLDLAAGRLDFVGCAVAFEERLGELGSGSADVARFATGCAPEGVAPSARSDRLARGRAAAASKLIGLDDALPSPRARLGILRESASPTRRLTSVASP